MTTKTKQNLLAEAPFLLAFLYAIGTVLPAIPYFNVVLAALGIVSIFISFVTEKMSLGKWILLLSCTAGTIVAFAFTKEEIFVTNEIAYYIIFGFYVLYFLNSMDKLPTYIERYKKYMLFICSLWHVVVLISIPFPSSWNGKIFQSFAGDTFRLAPSAMLIMGISLLFVVYFKKKYVGFSFLPFLSIILGSSRTYMAVGLALMVLILYFSIRRRITYLGVLLVFGVAALVIIMNSAMGDKILGGFEHNEYLDPLAQFTSGRSNFWKDNLDAFAAQPWHNKLLGCGYNFVRQQSVTDLRPQGIWAHNDFIQVLLTFGYVGLATYLCLVVALFKRIFTRKVPFVVKFSMLFIWFFNAMFNMVYTYMCATISLYLMVMAIEMYYQKKEAKAQA